MEKAREILDRWFVEREFFLRTDGRVHYQIISRRMQISVAVTGLLVTAWLAYASVNVIFHQQIVSAKVSEIDRQRVAYFDLLSEVAEYHEQFTQMTGNLEDNQTYLLSLLARDNEEPTDLADVEWQLKDSGSERARVDIARAGLKRRLESFESELTEIAGSNPSLEARVGAVLAAFSPAERDVEREAEARAHLGRKLDRAEIELQEVTKSRSEMEARLEALRQEAQRSEKARRELSNDKSVLNDEVQDLEDQLSQARQRQSVLEKQVASLESSLGAVVGRGERLEKERSFLNSRIVGLEGRLIDMRDAQQAIVTRLTERTLLSIGTLETAVTMTGVDLDNLLSVRPTADSNDDQGGPFIPSEYVVEQDPVSSLQSSIASLDLQIDRWEGLQSVIRSLPLTAPLDQFRITSSFGTRHDPVNKRKSKHHGIDLGAPMYTPIMVTAPGKVVYAGWKGYYGRFIEVDHGNGIRTRYGHLKKILVKVGQKVSNREKIGLLGSSGRSTGPHVHYEVVVNRKSYDPMNFLKAGQNVFKG